MNFILSLPNISSAFFLNSFLFLLLIFLNLIKLLSDKANIFIIASINPEIKAEYSICGILYIKLKSPPSSYILCIVSSLKKRALTVKVILKLKKKRNILIILELKSNKGKKLKNKRCFVFIKEK